MSAWKMTCTCGDAMESQGDTRDEAVDNLMVHMTPDAVSAHMADKHPGEPVPSQEMVRAGLMMSAAPA